MGDPIHRRPGILVRRVEVTTVESVDDGNIIFFSENGIGNGTQTDPTNLPGALALAGVNDVLFALADDGNIDITAAPGSTVGLLDGQQLLGFDSKTAVTVTLPNSGVQVVIQDLTGAGRATLVTPGGATNGVTLADNNLVEGLQLGTAAINSGLSAISGTTVSNATIQDMIITNSVANGIELLTGSDDAYINDVTMTMIGTNGLLSMGDSLRADDLTVTGAGMFGIVLQSGSTNAVVDSPNVSSTGSSGIAGGATTNTLISNATVAMTGGTGIDFTGDTVGMRINNANITNTTGSGIGLAGTNTDVEIQGVVIDTTSLEGIAFNGADGVTIGNTQISGTTTEGIRFTDPGPNNVAINGTTITSPGGIGVSSTDATNFALNAVTVTNPGTTAGVSFAGTTSGIALRDVDISVSAAGVTNVTVAGVTGLVISGGNFDNTGAGNSILTVAGAGDYSLTNITASKNTAVGSLFPIDIAATSPTGDIRLTGLRFTSDVGSAAVTGDAVRVLTTSSTTALNHTIINNRIENPGANGLEFGNVSSSSETWTVSGNVVNEPIPGLLGESGILFGAATTVAGSPITAFINNNVVSRPGANGFVIQLPSGAQAGTASVRMTSNSSVQAVSSGVAIQEFSTAGAGRLNATVISHSDANSGVALSASDMATSVGTLCVTLEKNVSNSVTGISVIKAGGGVVQATDGTVAGLTAANPGISGTITVGAGVVDIGTTQCGP